MNIIDDIKKSPTIVNNIHKSIYQSSQLLRYVTEMLERGDSTKTILDVIRHVQEREVKAELPTTH